MPAGPLPAPASAEVLPHLRQSAPAKAAALSPPARSCLRYKVLREGSGDSHPTVDSSCSCHYAGTLIDGTEFDSSYGRGEPTDFAPNQVIKGWTEAMQLMVEGDKWEMYIPSDLGCEHNNSSPDPARAIKTHASTSRRPVFDSLEPRGRCSS
jgi:FKBP-type peptidyl-prolyl cis-trans isomerase